MQCKGALRCPCGAHARRGVRRRVHRRHKAGARHLRVEPRGEHGLKDGRQSGGEGGAVGTGAEGSREGLGAPGGREGGEVKVKAEGLDGAHELLGYILQRRAEKPRNLTGILTFVIPGILTFVNPETLIFVNSGILTFDNPGILTFVTQEP